MIGKNSNTQCLTLFDPFSFSTLNPKGSWAGWAVENESELLFTESVETPVDGLFMAGAWVAGAGQSVALSTGIQAASAAESFMAQ